MPGLDHVPIGITMAGGRGEHTVYRFGGQAGLDMLSVSCDFTAPDPDLFRARLMSAPLGDIGIDDLTSTKHSCARTPERIAAIPWDHLQISFMQSGSARIVGHDREVLITPGRVGMLWTGAPFHYETEGDSRLTTVAVPTKLLRLNAKRLPELQNVLLESTPMISAFAGFIKTLADGTPADGTPASEFVAHALTDLVRAVVADHLGHEEEPGAHGMRVRVRDYIDRHLLDPGLGVDAVARGVGISPRYVHRLFESEPLTLAQHIRALRVDRLRAQLATTMKPFDQVALSSGFGSTDAAYRAFRELELKTPAEYRAAVRLAAEEKSAAANAKTEPDTTTDDEEAL